MRATLIYNPRAGAAELGGWIERLKQRWVEKGWAITVVATERPGHATELARHAAESGQQLVWVAGGDGTLGEAVNGLVGSETILAPLPAGTGNSFTKELLLPRPHPFMRGKLLEAAELLEKGTVQRMDLGKSNGRYWLLWAGTGVDGFLVDQLEPRSKFSKKLGALGYFIQGIYHFPKFPGMQIELDIDGKRYAGAYHMVLVSNSRRFGGGELHLSPDAVLDDGLFEIWLFAGNEKRKILWNLMQIRRHKHFTTPGIERVRGRHIVLQCEPSMPYHLDGDAAGHSPLECQLVPKAVRVLVPPTVPNTLFQEKGVLLADLID